MSLFVDYAWQHPNPGLIASDGYAGALRYLSTDPTKNLTADEATLLHAAGLSIGLVWETSSQRALDGFAAGAADATAANQQADTIGVPSDVAVFFAVDFAADASLVLDYFRGVLSVAGRPAGVYGSFAVVQAVHAIGVPFTWQTCAWSAGQVWADANLYQRQAPTRTPLAGTDEDVVLNPFPVWGPTPSGQSTQVASVVPAALRIDHLAEDGRLGPQTIRAMQRDLGVTDDGVIGPKTREALQRRVHANPDGVIGPHTVEDLQRHVGAHVDGIWPSYSEQNVVDSAVVSDTTRHLQAAINAGRL